MTNLLIGQHRSQRMNLNIHLAPEDRNRLVKRHADTSMVGSVRVRRRNAAAAKRLQACSLQAMISMLQDALHQRACQRGGEAGRKSGEAERAERA